jgi:tetratricopeptide (TPR) repeat protein
MTTKAFLPSSHGAQEWREIDDLYHQLLYWYYDRENLPKARPVARRLERLLSEVNSQTILGESAWSLVLESKGDLPGAIQHRQNEIGLMRRLLQISAKASDPKAVLKHYDFADLSDRLDLLAILYHDAGNLEQAIKVLRQSKSFCENHGIPFDGNNLLQDYLAEQKSMSRQSRQSRKNSQKKAV